MLQQLHIQTSKSVPDDQMFYTRYAQIYPSTISIDTTHEYFHTGYRQFIHESISYTIDFELVHTNYRSLSSASISMYPIENIQQLWNYNILHYSNLSMHAAIDLTNYIRYTATRDNNNKYTIKKLDRNGINIVRLLHCNNINSSSLYHDVTYSMNYVWNNYYSSLDGVIRQELLQVNWNIIDGDYATAVHILFDTYKDYRCM